MEVQDYVLVFGIDIYRVEIGYLSFRWEIIKFN